MDIEDVTLITNKIEGAVKFILIYTHRYAGLWCIIMGYVVLFALMAFGPILNFDTLRAVGILITAAVVIISIFAEEKFQRDIYRSFGVWW